MSSPTRAVSMDWDLGWVGSFVFSSLLYFCTFRGLRLDLISYIIINPELRSPTLCHTFTQKNHALAAEVLQKCRFCVPRSARARTKIWLSPSVGLKFHIFATPLQSECDFFLALSLQRCCKVRKSPSRPRREHEKIMLLAQRGSAISALCNTSAARVPVLRPKFMKFGLSAQRPPSARKRGSSFQS